MKNIFKIIVYCSFFVLKNSSLFSQINIDDGIIASLNKDSSNERIKISSINVTGNKHTKYFIILREVPFKAGDTLNKNLLPQIFKQARAQVYNINLFTEVSVDSIPLPDSTLQVNIKVKERWYIFPTPQFQLFDRNFKEWIKIYNADLDRVIYGLKFAHYNFSGRRDQLKVFLLNGYARNISASYSLPYSNAKLTEGFGVSAGFTQNREAGYMITDSNKLRNYRKEGFVRSNFNASLSYSKRKGFFKSTNIGIGFNRTNVDDSILTSKFNPTYFNDQKKQQNIFDVGLNVFYANTNNNNYPQKGIIYNYGISKRGLGFRGGINALTLSGSISKFFTHKRNWFSIIQTTALLKLPFEQAFINRRAIGFGSLSLRGLEVYIVDGVAAAVTKYTLTKEIVSFKIPIPFKIKSLSNIPVSIFAKTFSDVGYSYLPNKYYSILNNKLLYTGGFGLDILTLYDIVIKVEYSFNQLGEKGLFLRGKGNY